MSEVIMDWEKETFPLVEAAKELKAADAALRKMLEFVTKDFTQFERAWRHFLHCIERCWNKTCVEARGRKNWQRIESEYQHVRKTDELLKYLVHARNVSEHTIAPLTKDFAPNLNVKPAGDKLRIEFDEWKIPLLPITDRGTLYTPPTEHLGIPWSHCQREGVSEPRIAAELAMKFYVEFINRVSREVYPGGHA